MSKCILLCLGLCALKNGDLEGVREGLSVLLLLSSATIVDVSSLSERSLSIRLFMVVGVLFFLFGLIIFVGVLDGVFVF